MSFEILTAVKMLMLVFGFVMPCGLVGRYHGFRETYCVRLWNIGIYIQVHTVLQPCMVNWYGFARRQSYLFQDASDIHCWKTTKVSSQDSR
jgi:hypothetical protein